MRPECVGNCFGVYYTAMTLAAITTIAVGFTASTIIQL